MAIKHVSQHPVELYRGDGRTTNHRSLSGPSGADHAVRDTRSERRHAKVRSTLLGSRRPHRVAGPPLVRPGSRARSSKNSKLASSSLAFLLPCLARMPRCFGEPPPHSTWPRLSKFLPSIYPLGFRLTRPRQQGLTVTIRACGAVAVRLRPGAIALRRRRPGPRRRLGLGPRIPRELPPAPAPG